MYIHTHALEHTNIAPKAVNTNLLMRPWSNKALLWKQQQNGGKIETFFSAGIWRKLRGIWVSSTHLQVSPNFIKILNRVNTSDVLWGSAGSFLAGSEQAWFMVATWVTMSVFWAVVDETAETAWINQRTYNEDFGHRWVDSHLLGFISEALVVVLGMSLPAENQPLGFDFPKLCVLVNIWVPVWFLAKMGYWGYHPPLHFPRDLNHYMNKANTEETGQGYGMQPGKSVEGAVSRISPHFCCQENLKIDTTLNKLRWHECWVLT